MSSRHIHHRKMNLQGVITMKYYFVLILLMVGDVMSTDCIYLAAETCPKANVNFTIINPEFCTEYLKHHKCLHEIQNSCVDFYGYLYYNICVAYESSSEENKISFRFMFVAGAVIVFAMHDYNLWTQ
ncbi:uncharacterized protein LOC128249936 [Octopus bimaculoides]|uniref:uncharacterized protein LOC128249936 n=1 Tax=Octopus bimaculoides TaxID=37653 RepID=UPI0022E98900|nr:uncharacterized protein LOC128249936 [Octopus bimaculoides]